MSTVIKVVLDLQTADVIRLSRDTKHPSATASPFNVCLLPSGQTSMITPFIVTHSKAEEIY
jgi:hypothetical protein